MPASSKKAETKQKAAKATTPAKASATKPTKPAKAATPAPKAAKAATKPAAATKAAQPQAKKAAEKKPAKAASTAPTKTTTTAPTTTPATTTAAAKPVKAAAKAKTAAAAPAKKAQASALKPKAAISKKGKPARKGPKPKIQMKKVTIDCSHPVEDKIMDAAHLEKFLHDKIKVNGKAGVLGNAVSIKRKKTKVIVSAVPPFSKRYIKYLTRKFLKKQQLRDWLRIVASAKNAYEIKYYNIHENEDEEEEDEEATS